MRYKMKEEDRSKLSLWYNIGMFILEILIILACFGGIITCGILVCSNRQYEKELNLIFTPNNTTSMTNSLEAIEDNLKTYIDDHEQLLEDKYNSFLEKKEQDIQIVTLSSILVSIVICK